MFLNIFILLNGFGVVSLLVYFGFLSSFFSKVSEEEENGKNDVVSKKEEEPYERKYMTKYKEAPNYFEFTKEEKVLQKRKEEEWKEEYQEKYKVTRKEIIVLTRELIKMKKESIEEAKESGEEEIDTEDMKELQEKIDELTKEILLEKDEIQIHAENYAKQEIIEKRVEKLKKNILIEKTPLGNVIMFYDKNKESFSYYSDNTLPYRFLETVARKYVVTFGCKNIYVDMEEVLKEAEKKRDEKKEKEEEEKKRRLKTNEPEKKSVFAKFKNYNKEGLKTAGIVKKNQTVVATANGNQDVLLKDNANRYTLEGRFLDYNILQKVDRKINDKRLALSFSDFKKLQHSL